MGLLARAKAFLKTEPALLVTATADVVSFGADFGLHLTSDQQKGLFGLASALTAIVIRQVVTPNSKAGPVGPTTLESRIATLEAAVSELATPAPAAPSAPTI